MPTDRDYRALAEELGVRGRVVGDELRSRCPIHEGRDANFSLNVRTGMWNCFSQCQGGSFEQLVRAVLGVGPVAALDWLLERETGVSLAPAPTEALAGPERPEWLLAYEAATQQQLPAWWFERGLTWETAATWGVRWHPLLQRIIIPVYWQGELVGTVTRQLRDKPKYLNSPGLPKRELLFGAVPPVTGTIVLVEAPLDVIWLQQLGYPAAALMGLQLSQAQFLLLSTSGGVTLALDNDEPGREAQREIARRLQGVVRVDAVAYPPGRKDVGECSAIEVAEMARNRCVAV